MISKKLEKKIRQLPHDTDWEIKEAIKLVPHLRKALSGNGYIYADVTSVAHSGMSRKIILCIVVAGEIINLNRTIFSYVYGDRIDKNFKVTINGCGMDMLFEATHRLHHFLYEGQDGKKLNRYRWFL